jgi:hypothetical protein
MAAVDIPYVPFKTFLTALDTLSQGVPSPIDRSVFGNQSGSTQGMLLQSFRALKLVNEQNEPQPLLHRIVKSEERRAALHEALKATYPEVLALGAAATQKQFDDTFSAVVGADTKKKAKSFFLQAAHMVGITLSPHISPAKAATAENGASPRPARKRVARKAKKVNEPSANGATTNGSETGANGGNGASSNLHGAVQAWINELPPMGEKWDEADFQEWLSVFEQTMRRAYKLPKQTAKKPSD